MTQQWTTQTIPVDDGAYLDRFVVGKNSPELRHDDLHIVPSSGVVDDGDECG